MSNEPNDTTSKVEPRRQPRDSLFLLATCQFHGSAAVHRIKVRNLSPGGLMAEAAVSPQIGQLVLVNLRNVGLVQGQVAWVRDTRFGVQFAQAIDPQVVRQVPEQSLTVQDPDQRTYYQRGPVATLRRQYETNLSKLRMI